MTGRAAILAAQSFKFPKSRLVLGGGMGYNNGVSEMCMLDEMRAKREEIYAIVRRHKAEKLWVFGLCARKDFSCDDSLKEVWNG